MNRQYTKNRTTAIILVVLSMVFYGVSFPATKMLLEVYNPTAIITFRLIVSSILLMIANVMFHRRESLPAPADLPKFILVALFQPFLYFLCEINGMRFITAAISSIIVATMPVVTPLLSRIFIRERITRNNIIGALLSFAGVITLVLFSGNGQQGGTVMGEISITGVLLTFGAVLSAVLYTIVVRKIPVRYSPLTITATQNSLGLLLFLPLFIIFEWDNVSAIKPEAAAITSIVFLAVFASSLAFIFLNYGIQKLGPNRANGFVNLVPVVTAVTSFLFFGEIFTVIKIAGMLVVLVGVMISQRK